MNLLHRRQRGAAPLDAVIGIVVLMTLLVGVMEVAFALYARNVVAAAAHEGARAAAELGHGGDEAEAVARAAVERAAGGLLSGLTVATEVVEGTGSSLVRVRVDATMKPLGPVPLPLHFTSLASTRAPEQDL